MPCSSLVWLLLLLAVAVVVAVEGDLLLLFDCGDGGEGGKETEGKPFFPGQ